jgi:hypothetical protein
MQGVALTRHMKERANRARLLKTLHEWHWISSALCLVGMLLFSITGVTLNHASQIEAKARVETRSAQLPEGLRASLESQASARGAEKTSLLPVELRRWLAAELALEVDQRAAEWSADEIYLPMPRAGGDAWLRLSLSDGEVEYENTDRGWISYLNDLHKGRHTGVAWSWFIDVFALACLVFSITGLFILKMHAANRAATWPMVGLGLLIPTLLALLFIH